MGYKTIDLSCPGCNASLNINDRKCNFCGRDILISNFNSVYSMPMQDINKYTNLYKKQLEENSNNNEFNRGIAICYLKLKLYDEALKYFERAIIDNFNDSETYFYAATCMLKGKKAFLAQRNCIDKIIEYINAANAIEPKGIYYYFLAYIKYDYFKRKCYYTSPDYNDCLNMANEAGVTEYDIDILFNGLLGVKKPDIF